MLDWNFVVKGFLDHPHYCTISTAYHNVYIIFYKLPFTLLGFPFGPQILHLISFSFLRKTTVSHIALNPHISLNHLPNLTKSLMSPFKVKHIYNMYTTFDRLLKFID